jgi:hypothetical protein
MRVTSISVSVRYSKQMGDGSYKTVELGCEGALEKDENWWEAQADFYHQLGDQMRCVFNSSGKAQNGPENAVAPLAEAALLQYPQGSISAPPTRRSTGNSPKTAGHGIATGTAMAGAKNAEDSVNRRRTWKPPGYLPTVSPLMDN